AASGKRARWVQPDRRFRRLRCTAQLLAGGCLQRLHRGGVGALGHDALLQRPGIPNQVHLDSSTIVKIYLGPITNRNDPAIVKLNPKVKLPNLAITSVHRSDGSGDTYAFTDYFSKVSPTFKAQVGNSTLVQWPGGVGASGTAGVAGIIANTPGAIGYLKPCAVRKVDSRSSCIGG